MQLPHDSPAVQTGPSLQFTEVEPSVTDDDQFFEDGQARFWKKGIG